MLASLILIGWGGDGVAVTVLVTTTVAVVSLMLVTVCVIVRVSAFPTVNVVVETDVMVDGCLTHPETPKAPTITTKATKTATVLVIPIFFIF
jgi:hypothetical protein